MRDISDHFSSRAKFRILELFCSGPSPFPLRQIAYHCRLPVFSVQRGLEDFCRTKLVRRARNGRFVLFSLRSDHPDYPVITRMFRALSEARLADRAETYGERASNALRFASSFHEMMKHARG